MGSNKHNVRKKIRGTKGQDQKGEKKKCTVPKKKGGGTKGGEKKKACIHIWPLSYYYICVLILIYMCPHTVRHKPRR